MEREGEEEIEERKNSGQAMRWGCCCFMLAMAATGDAGTGRTGFSDTFLALPGGVMLLDADV